MEESHWEQGQDPHPSLHGGFQGQEGAWVEQIPGLGQRDLSGWLWLEVRGERALGLWMASSQLRTWSLLWEWGLLKVWGLEMA